MHDKLIIDNKGIIILYQHHNNLTTMLPVDIYHINMSYDGKTVWYCDERYRNEIRHF